MENIPSYNGQIEKNFHLYYCYPQFTALMLDPFLPGDTAPPP